jgi:hypothetical protein
LGKREDGRPERIDPYGTNVLIAGPSGSGKSTVTTGILERLAEAAYQFVIIDPEGDYSDLEFAVTLGDAQRAPLADEFMHLLADPEQNAVVNLLGIPLEHRPAFFDQLLPRLQEMRTRTGRPHWIVVDEAHHLLHTRWAPGPLTMPKRMQGMLFITVHAETVAAQVLKNIDLVVAVGKFPEKTLTDYCQAIGKPPPKLAGIELGSGEVLLWRRREGPSPIRIHTEPPRTERRRHVRKYALGDLGEKSFHFRGPDGKLNLKAQNLVLFLQIADGVDEGTWEYHLRHGEYSAWFREAIKDDKLAETVRQIEGRKNLSPAQSRAAIRAAIEQRYTLPSELPRVKTPEEERAEARDAMLKARAPAR